VLQRYDPPNNCGMALGQRALFGVFCQFYESELEEIRGEGKAVDTVISQSNQL